MDFRDELKNVLESGKMEDEDSKSKEDKIIDGNVEIDERSPEDMDEPSHKNFKYLDNLIQSGVKEVVLDSDIVLGDDEDFEYVNGIELDVDDIVVDGNGHFIDACEKAGIFWCRGKNIVIRNIHLKNGFVKGIGGAVLNAGDMTITDSTFTRNTSNGDGGAICNDGVLIIKKSIFAQNSSGNDGGAIYNRKGELSIFESTFNENEARHNRGGAISNFKGILTITNSILNGNNASSFGGAVYNRMGELSISKSRFEENTVSSNRGGAIYNNGGILDLMDIECSDNVQYHYSFVPPANNDVYNMWFYIWNKFKINKKNKL